MEEALKILGQGLRGIKMLTYTPNTVTGGRQMRKDKSMTRYLLLTWKKL